MDDWKTLRTQRFPSDILTAAQHTERMFGVPACVTLAQWALESAYGKHSPGNNPFGHKGSYLGQSVLFTTHEVINGKSVELVDKFCRYPDIEVAFKEHGRKLAYGKPYLGCNKFIGDWRAFVQCIGKIYATDPSYVGKIIALIERFHLYDYNLPKKEGN